MAILILYIQSKGYKFMKSRCPDSESMSAYIDGDLPDREKKRITRHLVDCDACTEEFAMVKILLNDREISQYSFSPAPDICKDLFGNVKKRLSSIVRWVSDLTPPKWMIAHGAPIVRSAVRGGSRPITNSVLMTKAFENLRAQLYIQQFDNEKINMAFKVFQNGKSAENVCMKLKKEGGRIMARLLRQEYLSIDSMNFGTYHMTLEQNAHNMGSFVFSIEKEGVYEKSSYLS